jgi:hypothetical protein
MVAQPLRAIEPRPNQTSAHSLYGENRATRESGENEDQSTPRSKIFWRIRSASGSELLEEPKASPSRPTDSDVGRAEHRKSVLAEVPDTIAMA